MLRPRSFDIQKQDLELEAAQVFYSDSYLIVCKKEWSSGLGHA